MVDLVTDIVASSDGSYNSQYPTGNKPAGGLVSLFTDDYESYAVGGLANGSNANFAYTTFRPVSDLEAFDGTRSAEFKFASGIQQEKVMKWDLTSYPKEVTIEYELFIPSNYVHGTSADTLNKFLRLYADDYDTPSKVGLSLGAPADGGVARLAFQRTAQSATNGAVGTAFSVQSFLTGSDLGTWISMKIECVAATTTTEGRLTVYKNDALVGEMSLYTRAVDDPGYNMGYLLGYNNATFAAETTLYVDVLSYSEGVA